MRRLTDLIIPALWGAGMFFFAGCVGPSSGDDSMYATSKPYTRWWWFADEIKKDDIAHQLEWVKENNFGGVEIACGDVEAVAPLFRKRAKIIRHPDSSQISAQPALDTRIVE